MELLVVMMIITIAVLLTFPVLDAMQVTRVRAGVDVAGVASEAARKYSQRQIEFLADLGGGLHGQYSGTAIIITPAHEMRLVENDQFASAGGNNFLELMTPEHNGYKDIAERSYIPIPRGVGIAGLTRTGGDADDIKLIAPPFAIRFDPHGHLAIADDYSDDFQKPNFVFYDGDGNGTYDTSANSGRDNNYDPTDSDPDIANVAMVNLGTDNRWVLPFERLEAVVGVVVFDLSDFRDNFPNSNPWSGNGQTATDWIRANGQVVFFNRYTGLAIRGE